VDGIFEFRSLPSGRITEMTFASTIIDWYNQNKRSLPWRETTDPYKIWLSEIILQQTRVAQGLPYYTRFIEKFPGVKALAKANESEVLRLWQGLGYYSRARNLHRCAKKIVSDFKSEFPSTFSELQKLPGVGPYTAAAIASIAFREPVAVVDGNVFRLLARIFGIDLDIASQEARKYFFNKANELISQDQPDTFNQAMMEFGATWCTPKNPKCEDCIFKKSCVAFLQQSVAMLPVKAKKAKVRKRFLHYIIMEEGKKIAMKKREAKDIWHGLYDFHLIESKKKQRPQNILTEEFPKGLLDGAETFGPFKHILSHQELIIHFTWIKARKKINLKKLSTTFYSSRQVGKLPKPIVITRFLEEVGFIRKV
jgi:A/G-specific adenine glycosylase